MMEEIAINKGEVLCLSGFPPSASNLGLRLLMAISAPQVVLPASERR